MLPCNLETTVQPLAANLDSCPANEYGCTTEQELELKIAAFRIWEEEFELKDHFSHDVFDNAFSESLHACLNLQSPDPSQPRSSLVGDVVDLDTITTVTDATPLVGGSTGACEVDPPPLTSLDRLREQCEVHVRCELLALTSAFERACGETFRAARAKWLASVSPSCPARRGFQTWLTLLTAEVCRQAGYQASEFIHLYHTEGHTLEETSQLVGCSREDLLDDLGMELIFYPLLIAGQELAGSVRDLFVDLVVTMFLDSGLPSRTISVILCVPAPVVAEVTDGLHVETDD
jgi:hypothetical protein